MVNLAQDSQAGSGELLRVLRFLGRVDWAEGDPRVISV
jgi:hypothetical protein